MICLGNFYYISSMKIIIFILAIGLMACEKSNPTPEQEQCEQYCRCGEVLNYNQYYPSVNLTYEVKNNCTGSITYIEKEGFTEIGETMCLDFCW